MHKKILKICTGCRDSKAKIYLYYSTEIAKARPHSEEWQTDTSVQKQLSIPKSIINKKRIMFGTSDAWMTCHLSQQTSDPEYFIVGCQMFKH